MCSGLYWIGHDYTTAQPLTDLTPTFWFRLCRDPAIWGQQWSSCCYMDLQNANGLYPLPILRRVTPPSPTQSTPFFPCSQFSSRKSTAFASVISLIRRAAEVMDHYIPTLVAKMNVLTDILHAGQAPTKSIVLFIEALPNTLLGT